MQETALVHILHLQHHVPIAASTGRRHNILIEWKRNEDDDGDQVHHGAHCAHALRELRSARLAEVTTLEAVGHERGRQPANHGVGEAEGQDAEGERGQEGLARVGSESVDKERERGGRQGEMGEGLGLGEDWGDGGWHLDRVGSSGSRQARTEVTMRVRI